MTFTYMYFQVSRRENHAGISYSEYRLKLLKYKFFLVFNEESILAHKKVNLVKKTC